MVQAGGDGVNRPIRYAFFRDDKEADPGCSRELVSVDMDRKYWDSPESMPLVIPGCDTMLKLFKRHVRLTPERTFLGTREELGKDEKGRPRFGEYSWKNFKEVDIVAQAIARGISSMNLAT